MLTQIKSDLVKIKMKRPTLNSRVFNLIEDIDRYLNQLANETGNVFAGNKISKEEAHKFYNILLELYFDGLDQLRLEEVIETESEDMIISEFRSKFLELMEEISKFL